MNNVIKINGLLALFAIAFLLSKCGNSNADEATMKKSNAVREVSVQVQELQQRPFSETLQLSGAIKAYDDITLSPEEGGVVKEWKQKKGAFVSKGTVVVQLDDDIIKPSYDAALAQYKSAELTYEKQEKVFTEQAVSEWQLKTTEYGRDAAKAQSDLMQARWERTRIKSPISGILDERYAEKGEMAAPGVPIARVVNISRVKVVVNVPERYAGSIKKGTAVTLSVLAFPGKVFSGEISYIGATINSDNRTFPIEAVIPNSKMQLKPEMIAKVRIAQSLQKNALLIDEGIVQQVDKNKLVVYVVNDGKAHERVVQLGGRQDNLVEVVSGLKSGEKIVTSGYQEVIDGQPVNVKRSETSRSR